MLTKQGGGEHAGLQGRGTVRSTRSREIKGLVDDAGALGDFGGETGSPASPSMTEVVGHPSVAGTVDEPDRFAVRVSASRVASRVAPVPDITCGAALMGSPWPGDFAAPPHDVCPLCNRLFDCPPSDDRAGPLKCLAGMRWLSYGRRPGFAARSAWDKCALCPLSCPLSSFCQPAGRH
jgi:hypothetical protein